MKRIAIVMTLILAATFIFVFFTVPGRRLALCPFYERNRIRLMSLPEGERRLSLQWEERNPGAVRPRPDWLYLKVAGATIPLVPNRWEISKSTTSVTTVLLLYAKNKQNPGVLVLGLDEKFGASKGWSPSLLLRDLNNAYDLNLAINSRDLSKPCDPRQSARSLARDFALMTVKYLSIPPGEIQYLYRDSGSGILAIVMKLTGKSEDKWGINAYFPAAGHHFFATYVVGRESDVSVLLDQLTLVNDSTIAASPLPDSLKTLPEVLRQLGYEAISNSVAAYLNGSEIQKETAGQSAEIQRALNDMLREVPGDPDWLKRQRYADYGGKPGQWSVVTLLHKYFVPPKTMMLDEKTFFKDLRAPEAQAAVRDQIRRLSES